MSTTNIPVSNNHTVDTMQRPQWLDEQLYPFQSRFVEVEGNRIHYIDEGSGSSLATWMVQSRWDGWRALSASSHGIEASS